MKKKAQNRKVKIKKAKKPNVFEVVEIGHPTLRQRAKLVSKKELQSKSFQKTLDTFLLTLRTLVGVGIAAPQVGISKQFLIVHSKPVRAYPNAPLFGPEIMINPKLISGSKKMEKRMEGCLSIPGIRGPVSRHIAIQISYQDRNGKSQKMELKNFVARIFQHEFDHLNGVMFIDRVDSKDIISHKEYIKVLEKKEKEQKMKKKR